MAEYFGRITLRPGNDNGRLSYVAKGVVDFFGDVALVRVGGAGGQNRTAYAGLFRAALYR